MPRALLGLPCKHRAVVTGRERQCHLLPSHAFGCRCRREAAHPSPTKPEEACLCLREVVSIRERGVCVHLEITLRA